MNSTFDFENLFELFEKINKFFVSSYNKEDFFSFLERFNMQWIKLSNNKPNITNFSMFIEIILSELEPRYHIREHKPVIDEILRKLGNLIHKPLMDNIINEDGYIRASALEALGNMSETSFDKAKDFLKDKPIKIKFKNLHELFYTLNVLLDYFSFEEILSNLKYYGYKFAPDSPNYDPDWPKNRDIKENFINAIVKITKPYYDCIPASPDYDPDDDDVGDYLEILQNCLRKVERIFIPPLIKRAISEDGWINWNIVNTIEFFGERAIEKFKELLLKRIEILSFSDGRNVCNFYERFQKYFGSALFIKYLSQIHYLCEDFLSPSRDYSPLDYIIEPIRHGLKSSDEEFHKNSVNLVKRIGNYLLLLLENPLVDDGDHYANSISVFLRIIYNNGGIKYMNAYYKELRESLIYSKDFNFLEDIDNK